MLDSKYIYDLSEAQMRSMNTMSYPEGLLFLLEASTALNKKLNDVHYLERDFHRINKVVKAIKHNTQKLKDIYYYDFVKQQSTGAFKIHLNQSSIYDFLKAWFMKKFYILFPSDAYAIEWFAKSKKEFISEVKKYFGYKRFPNGTEYWESNN